MFVWSLSCIVPLSALSILVKSICWGVAFELRPLPLRIRTHRNREIAKYWYVNNVVWGRWCPQHRPLLEASTFTKVNYKNQENQCPAHLGGLRMSPHLLMPLLRWSPASLLAWRRPLMQQAGFSHLVSLPIGIQLLRWCQKPCKTRRDETLSNCQRLSKCIFSRCTMLFNAFHVRLMLALMRLASHSSGFDAVTVDGSVWHQESQLNSHQNMINLY